MPVLERITMTSQQVLEGIKMTSSSWLIIGIFLAMVLFTQLGWRKVTGFSLIRPYIAVIIVSAVYLHNFPTNGNDVVALLVSAAVGALFGWLMVLSTRVQIGEDGKAKVWCGPWYLLLWLAALGIRVLIAYTATSWYPKRFVHFMLNHHLSFTVVAPAFMLMTIVMIAVRSVGMWPQLRKVRGQSTKHGKAGMAVEAP
jgi:hypothetical protein